MTDNSTRWVTELKNRQLFILTAVEPQGRRQGSGREIFCTFKGSHYCAESSSCFSDCASTTIHHYMKLQCRLMNILGSNSFWTIVNWTRTPRRAVQTLPNESCCFIACRVLSMESILTTCITSWSNLCLILLGLVLQMNIKQWSG